MERLTTEAFVIKNLNYKDSDRIYLLFTYELGLVSCVARGVRKITSRRSGSLDTLNQVSVSLSKSNAPFYSIDEVKAVNTFMLLKHNLEKLNKVYYIFDLLVKTLPESIEHKTFYILLKKTLRALAAVDVERSESVVNFFQLHFLELHGYPLFKKETASQEISYDSESMSEVKFNNDELEYMKQLVENKIPASTSLVVINSVSHKLFNYITSLFDEKFKRLSIV